MIMMSCCASCGVTEGDDVKLKNCAACHLVKYCGVKCRKEHRPKHKRACKKRAAELHDEILFRQPESSNFGDCPICFLPLPLDENKSKMTTCCSKIICDGCCYAAALVRENEEQDQKCPFCRAPAPKSDAEGDKRRKNRAEMNDPVAMREVGIHCCGQREYQGAFEYLSKAAALGDLESHFQLAEMYHYGRGVEKDESKEVQHMERAAIGGHVIARHNLGCIESSKGHCKRAVKHWIIAAKLGDDESLEHLKKRYRNGVVSKDDFAAALRGHQAAVDAMKSSNREAAEAAHKTG